MSQLQEHAQQQVQAVPPAVQEQPAVAPQQDGADIFADQITEEMLGAMLDGDKDEQPVPGGEPKPSEPQEQQKKPEQVEPEAPKAEKPLKAEEQQEPEAYELEIFGQPAKLTGEQLTDLAEAGAQFLRHRPQVEQAMTLLNTVQGDPQLQAILTAYGNGQPLPQVGGRQSTQPTQPMQPMQPMQIDPNDPLGSMKTQLVAELVPQLRKQLMEQIQQEYKPFVDNVNKFAADYHQERAFNQYKADPDYSAVNDLMQRNVQAKVATGEISFEYAARIDAALKNDPNLYGKWFGHFKEAVKRGRTQPASTAQQAGDVKTVTRAPKLEGAVSADPEAKTETVRNALNRALQGDANAFNALYDNQ